MTTVLVCGASGLLGREVLREVGGVGTYFSRPFEGGIHLDSLTRVFDKVNPTVCINCVVERTVDTCENDWATTKRLNIDFVDELASLCTARNIHLVHISTDYVFDGRNPPYSPTSNTNPLQNYGISKLISEHRVMNVPLCSVIRVPVLYGTGPFGESAVTLIGHKVLDQRKQTFEDDTYPRRPVFVPDLAKYIADVVRNKWYGTLHFWNPEPAVTKYQIAQMIGDYLGKPIDHIKKSTSTMSASRPFDTTLTGPENPKYVTPLREGIEKCFGKLYHPPLLGQNVFIAMDLDGTLVDTDELHFNAYRAVKPDFTWDDVVTPELKQLKFMELTKHDIQFMPGADVLIEWISRHNIPHCVVTNTCRKTVELFKQKLPLLEKLKNWLVREDYVMPKPHGEPYQRAVQLYGQACKYIIGVENTEVGYNSLKTVTECIYIIGDEDIGTDVHRISNLTSILSPTVDHNSNSQSSSLDRVQDISEQPAISQS